MFGSMFESMFPQSYVSVCLAPRRQRQGGRRPVGRGVGGRIVALRLADTIRCGADIILCVYVRMIRILIKRVFSSGCVTSIFSTPYTQVPRNDTLAGGKLSPVLLTALAWVLLTVLARVLPTALAQVPLTGPL